MTLRLYNTLTRREEEFHPGPDDTVRMYTCGLTVYARGHIGNFRTFICTDVLRRTLRHLLGYRMTHVMNYTDVDDRTIAGAQKEGLDLRAYTDKYIEMFREDAQALGLEQVEETPRATDEANLRAMASMIAALSSDIPPASRRSDPTTTPLTARRRQRHRQHRMRARFDEHAVPVTDQLGQRQVQPHRLPQVATPIGSVQRCPLAARSRHRRHHRHLPSLRRKVRQQAFQLRQDRIHLGAVRGVVHIHLAAEHAFLGEPLTQRSTASLEPETTVEAGVFTTASDRPDHSAAFSRSSTAAAASSVTAMAPRPLNRRSNWLRSATTRSASSSDKMPATTAAAISPWL